MQALNSVIDEFIAKQREKELEALRKLSTRMPRTAAKPSPQQQKVRLINAQFPFGCNIDVTLHHSSRFPGQGFYHYHDFFEMIYVYRGGCCQRFANGEMQMKQHDLLLLNPNTVHAPYTTEEDDCMFNILIAKPLFEQSMLAMISDNKIFSNFILDCLYQVSKARDYLYFAADESSLVSQITENLIVELLQKQVSYQKAMEAWLILLFTQLSRQYHSDAGGSLAEDGETNRTVADILSYMNDHAASVTLEELSELFGYSVGHLSRLIRKHTGKPYSEIVQKLKLEKARYYLETSDDPITEVMRRSGFSAAHHFYRIFKERYLMSPAEYRKSIVQAKKV